MKERPTIGSRRHGTGRPPPARFLIVIRTATGQGNPVPSRRGQSLFGTTHTLQPGLSLTADLSRVDCGAVAIEGLYLNFAVICERVLREADDVLSFIRIVDQVNVKIVAPPGVDVPEELPLASSVSLTLAIGLKSAGYTGPVTVKLWVEAPTGSRLPEFQTTQEIALADRGVNLIVPVQLPVQDEGIYWFVVEVSGDVLTRVPLRIGKQVVQQSVPPSR